VDYAPLKITSIDLKVYFARSTSFTKRYSQLINEKINPHPFVPREACPWGTPVFPEIRIYKDFARVPPIPIYLYNPEKGSE
jgi:hypothetical protein